MTVTPAAASEDGDATREAALDTGDTGDTGDAVDTVDTVVRDWSSLRPDLDFRPFAVTIRLAQLRGHLETAVEANLRAHDVRTSDFAALITLMRIGENGISQHRLAEELGLTPGTVSARIDRLVSTGLAERGPAPDSKRRVLVTPTPTGRDLFERVIASHLDTEDRLLAALSDEERDQLAGLLRSLLVEFGQRQPATVDRTGLDLAPAHETISKRAAVGLDRTPGLLVRAVASASPAAAAGLRPGDVLVQVSGRELRSRSQLSAILDDAPQSVELTALRGEERMVVQLVFTAQPGSKKH